VIEQWQTLGHAKSAQNPTINRIRFINHRLKLRRIKPLVRPAPSKNIKECAPSSIIIRKTSFLIKFCESVLYQLALLATHVRRCHGHVIRIQAFDLTRFYDAIIPAQNGQHESRFPSLGIT
jgi:hypothetical protein